MADLSDDELRSIATATGGAPHTPFRTMRAAIAADRALNAAPSVGAGGLPLQAAFETWAADQGCHLAQTVQGGDYQDLRTQIAWDSWQACAALASRPAVDADKRDAERWRALRSGEHLQFSVLLALTDPPPVVSASDGWEEIEGDDLDAAIDAARTGAG